MTIAKKISIICLFALFALSCNADVQPDSLWNKEFGCAQDIIDTYSSSKKSIKKSNKEQQIINSCHYVWQCGEYMFKCRGKNDDIYTLSKYAPELDLDNEIVSAYMEKHDVARFADHYFTLQAMKQGSEYEEARDGITMTVFFPLRSMNSNDYNKLSKVFSSKNEALHTAYLKKLIHPLTNSGCNKELVEIRTLIENNVTESELKEKVLSLYDIYATIMPGMPAPDVTFKDAEGNRYSINGYKGTVIVIDVWATWCNSCLKNMPLFMQLIKDYEGCDDVVFFTVSTDSDDIKDKWLASIKKHKMDGMLNLTPDRSAKAQFEEKYFVSSVPRYIVIDKQGNIVSAFAPKPSDALKQLINESRKQ